MTVHQFIRSIGLRHFSPEEVLVHTERPGNSLPPRELWHNIVSTLLVLDDLRAHLKRPIRITSCYRAEEYNRRVGGGRRSQHVAFSAVDFQVLGVTPAVAAHWLRGWRGRLFEARFRIERIHHATSAGQVPFKRLATFSEDRGDRAAVEWHGGVGEYASFVHVDSRGLDHGWRS